MQYYQQGDVLIKKIDKLPKGLVPLSTKVLQKGETTGHMHQFATDAFVSVFKLVANENTPEKTITLNEQKFIVVGDNAILRHEEHRPITIEPGIYEIDIVREFDYDKMEATRVVD